MLLSQATPIYPDDTAGSLHDRLSQIGAELLAENHRQAGKREPDLHRAGPFPGDLRSHAGKKRRPDRLAKACGTHRAFHPGDVPLAGRFHFSRQKTAQDFQGAACGRAKGRRARNGPGGFRKRAARGCGRRRGSFDHRTARGVGQEDERREISEGKRGRRRRGAFLNLFESVVFIWMLDKSRWTY